MPLNVEPIILFSMADSVYSNFRAAVDETGSETRVEVNQRALIDKILARYASAGAVYRELLQNSDDAVGRFNPVVGSLGPLVRLFCGSYFPLFAFLRLLFLLVAFLLACLLLFC